MSCDDKSFIRNDRGAVAMVFGVSFLALAMTIGLAIDSARYYSTASDLQDALDAATLTGAKALGSKKTSDQEIIKLTKAIFQDRINKQKTRFKTLHPLDVVLNHSDNSVKATSTGDVRSLFAGIFNRPSMTEISAEAVSIYNIDKVELALVLDITGSMNIGSRLSDMKTAANEVIDELFDGAINDDNVRIALVPYSASVNGGPFTAALASSSGSSHHGMPAPYSDDCFIERPAPYSDSDAAPNALNAPGQITSLPYGNYLCPSSAVVPLRGRLGRDYLKATVNAYTAQGATAGHLGTAWGWYMLSPEWSSLMPAESQPVAYNEDHSTKAILIMTDGSFNTAYRDGPSASASVQLEDSYSQFQSLCSNMKAKGIQVYTVGFELTDPRAISELSTCATSAGHFFDPQNGDDLKAAFKAVVKDLGQLRVAS